MKKATNHEDRKTVDNSSSEIYHVKRKYKLKDFSSVTIAKKFVGNKREDVYKWLDENKGKTITITIE